MKIIHVMPDIYESASGPSYSVIRLCEALRKAAVDSEIALIGEPTDKPYIHPFAFGPGPRRLGNSPALLQWLKDRVRRKDVDIVHNHSFWKMPNVYPGWVTRRQDIPYVVSPRGTLSEWAMKSGSVMKRLFWPFVQRPSLRHAACFHATSRAEYRDIRRMGFAQPVAIIPNGIDLPVYGRAISSERRTLLFLGRLHPVKGVDILLKCWSLLEEEFPEWDLKIVGPIEDENARRLVQLSIDLRLRRVEFIGPLYDDAKVDCYRSADLYVLPSHSENFAVTVAEALATGTPAVVSKGAPWSGLEANKAGWWPDIGHDPLLSALRSAMAKPRSELLEMGKNGQHWMQRDFDWSKIASQMLDTYTWLLGRGPKPDCVEIR